MKRFIILAILVCVCYVSSGLAQLTSDQKMSDFLSLAGLYNKNYGPYQWKLGVFNYDVLNLQPWLAQVKASKDDLSFYDICVRYVAGLNDFHDEFILPSSYEAFLPFSVDVYDGTVLIDGIDRSLLPTKTYPFQIGDQLVSVDGTSVSDWMVQLAPYAVNGEGNPVSRSRLTANIIIDRYQGWYTYASNVQPGASAAVQIKRQNGNLESYSIAWQTLGIPLLSEGPVPNIATTTATAHATASTRAIGIQFSVKRRRQAEENAWGIWTGQRPAAEATAVPRYMAVLQRLRTMSHTEPAHPVAGSIAPFGSIFPAFNPPAGFRLRLGSKATDEFLSGTFPLGQLRIGYIRIPSMSPTSQTNALTQFRNETTYFQANTDGLVIDVMANGGGDLCYTNTLTTYLIPTPFRTMGLNIRATESWLQGFENAIISAELSGADQWVIDLYTAYANEVQQALSENRGMTGPLPVCDTSFQNTAPATDSKGNNIAYTKPIVLLTDNFSASAAESFGATLQDAQRATVYGTRTSGGGGNVLEFDNGAGPYSEGTARVTASLEVRAQPIQTPGFPAAPYIENIGVYPDVTADFMTADNLLHGGAKFVTGFSTVISNLITEGHP